MCAAACWSTRRADPGLRASTCRGRGTRAESRSEGGFEQRVRVVNALHQCDFAARAAAQSGLEGRLDRQQRVRVIQALGVDLTAPVDVVVELALIRPHGVFHVERQLVLAPVDRHLVEVQVLQRRPRQRHQQLGLDVVAELVEFAHPLLEIALLDAQGQTFVRGPVTNRGHGDDRVRGPAAVGVVAVPQQPGVRVGADASASIRLERRPRNRLRHVLAPCAPRA